MIGGFYREWASGDDHTQETQLSSLEIFTNQMEEVATEKKEMIILGDANLCTLKWNEDGFIYMSLANQMKSTLAQCGLTNLELGNT